jgi:uncharacterized membrane protein YqjE
MAEAGERGAGARSGTVRRAVEGLVALAQARVQLFLLEWEEEKWRLVDLLAWMLAAAGLALVLLLTLTFLLGWLLYQWAGWNGLCLLVALYAFLAVLAVLQVKKRLRPDTPPFGGTLAEFRKDRAWLHGNDSRKSPGPETS